MKTVVDCVLFPVEDKSQVGEARRQVAVLAEEAGITAALRDKLALLVTELGTNLVKHAGGGEMIVRLLRGRSGLDLLVLDGGAGMSRIDECLRDGYSTSGSPGTGLGAVQRLASVRDLYSARPGGTAIIARIDAGGQSDARPAGLDIGAVCLPKTGQEICGDAWGAATGSGDVTFVLVADGLGHGLGAADASRAALRLFEARPDLPPAAQVRALHEGLRGTRGAAVAVARVDHRARTLTFAGVGNVAGSVIANGTSQQLVSLNGTAGHSVRRINEFTYPWPKGSLLVLHTDGLGSRWDLARYPGLASRHPALVAGLLFRDYNRRSDDVTVVAAADPSA